MHDLVQDLPNYTLNELNQVSISNFFNRFKDSIVELTKTNTRIKKKTIQKTLTKYLDDSEKVVIDENHKKELLQAIDKILS